MGMFDWLKRKTEADSILLGKTPISTAPKNTPPASSSTEFSPQEGVSPIALKILESLKNHPDAWEVSVIEADPLSERERRYKLYDDPYPDRSDTFVVSKGRLALHSGKIEISIEKYYQLVRSHGTTVREKIGNALYRGEFLRPPNPTGNNQLSSVDASQLFEVALKRAVKELEDKQNRWTTEITEILSTVETGYQLSLDLRT